MNVDIKENLVRVVILDISGIYAQIHNQGYFDEYSCAMKSHFRKSGNQMSGKWKSSCASLLA